MYLLEVQRAWPVPAVLWRRNAKKETNSARDIPDKFKKYGQASNPKFVSGYPMSCYNLTLEVGPSFSFYSF